jgi:hypothetical protein
MRVELLRKNSRQFVGKTQDSLYSLRKMRPFLCLFLSTIYKSELSALYECNTDNLNE